MVRRGYHSSRVNLQSALAENLHVNAAICTGCVISICELVWERTFGIFLPQVYWALKLGITQEFEVGF